MEQALIIIAVVAAVAASIWALQWGSVRRAQVAAGLKRDMLARGLSVEEIARLLNLASGPSARRGSEAAFALASAIETMAEAGKDTDEIALVVDAFLRQQGGPSELSREPNQVLQQTGHAIEAHRGSASSPA